MSDQDVATVVDWISQGDEDAQTLKYMVLSAIHIAQDDDEKEEEYLIRTLEYLQCRSFPQLLEGVPSNIYEAICRGFEVSGREVQFPDFKWGDIRQV